MFANITSDVLIFLSRFLVCGFQGTWVIIKVKVFIRQRLKFPVAPHYWRIRELKALPFAHGYSANILLETVLTVLQASLAAAPAVFLRLLFNYQMENTRFELVTSCLQGRRSPN